MTTQQRARARHNTQQVAQYTELWIVGTPQQVAQLVHVAKSCGALVYASAPTAMGGDDPRMRRYLRLRTH